METNSSTFNLTQRIKLIEISALGVMRGLVSLPF
jgi:hypothetical protein